MVVHLAGLTRNVYKQRTKKSILIIIWALFINDKLEIHY